LLAGNKKICNQLVEDACTEFEVVIRGNR